MSGLWIFLAGVAIVWLLVWRHTSAIGRRRQRLRQGRLSQREVEVLAERFPLWRSLPEATRHEAEGWIQVFLDEKSFEACGGLEEVTREMRLAVAAPACLLIAHRPADYYERLKSILIYPTAYRARGDDGSEDVRLGESWSTGSVVLGWSSVCQGGLNPEDGQNVVLHEFAHQLDQEDGAADGVPELEEVEDYGRWSRAFAPAYRDFCRRVDEGRRTVLDDYGAQNPAEFFAVATETFFEKPRQMRREEPEVYEALRDFYGMDPTTWEDSETIVALRPGSSRSDPAPH